tara:strand:- start:157567 stop:160740 length:3174 start_codon:yes stop_codon:yes gene_type:complete
MKMTYNPKMPWQGFLLALVVLMGTTDAFSQRRGSSSAPATTKFDESLYSALEWRSIGPFRGGRAATVTGVPNKPNLFYMGATGGGVWKTTDGGQRWENISDGFFGGSIGAVAVSEYDNNVIYVGGGEGTVRGNVSDGQFGIMKSTDAGKTWTDMGLPNALHIPRIRIHPKNPDLVYAAVLGDIWKSSADRGVYRSKDGGKSWEKVLFANADAGAVDISMDPGNPRVLFATTWRFNRSPYGFDSGGEGSALWKSTDGGDTWKNISTNKGLPSGIWGIAGVSVSPVNSNRVFAIIENDKGGVYRSDDGGDSWSLINSDRSLRQRAWYYTKIYADTENEDIVYVMNVNFHKSKDGGKTYEEYDTPHGDHHDLWIAPDDHNRIAVADDGGAQVSFDAGSNWSTYMNQPTSQFYRVVTDNSFPYRIYGAQQDNSTVRIRHRVDGGAITESDWEETAGGESAHIAPDPDNNDIVYGGSYGGYLTRVNHATAEERNINVWPDNPMGHGAEGMRFRFQWNFPIFFSPHNGNKLYTTSNQVHVSYNEGQSWETISPDLTRAEPEKLGPAGGPITKDNTAVEYYATIFAAVESPFEKDLIWTGSDDGLVHVTKDAGKTWENVTPPTAPKYVMWNSIDPDPFTKGGAYLAGTQYKIGDFKPYLFKTEDYGKTWKQITSGINPSHFTRVVRADPKRKGLLYAGTESGMYISFDDGASWSTFQLNLPTVPITDLAIKNDNLIAATQGRSFWLIDDLTPLHQLNATVAAADVHLFKPIDSYRMGGFAWRVPSGAGKNHHNGVQFFFSLKNEPGEKDTVTLEVMEADGDLIKKFSIVSKERGEKLTVKKGSNTFVWNMQYPAPEGFDGLIMWAARLTGPKAVPGTYKARLTANGKTSETEFTILKDPRTEGSVADIQAQFDFIQGVNAKMTETHQTIKDIRSARVQMNDLKDRLGKEDAYKELVESINEINKKMTAVEEELYQTKNRSGQDPLNYPIRLNNKLGHLSSVANSSDYKPTDQTIAVKTELESAINEQLSKWEQIKNSDIPQLNEKAKQKGVEAVMLKKGDASSM